VVSQFVNTSGFDVDLACRGEGDSTVEAINAHCTTVTVRERSFDDNSWLALQDALRLGEVLHVDVTLDDGSRLAPRGGVGAAVRDHVVVDLGQDNITSELDGGSEVTPDIIHAGGTRVGVDSGGGSLDSKRILADEVEDGDGNSGCRGRCGRRSGRWSGRWSRADGDVALADFIHGAFAATVSRGSRDYSFASLKTTTTGLGA